MEALKKSRSAYSGAVTRIWNRYARLLEEDPSSFDHGQLEHKLESIRNTDLSYHKIHEEISLAGEGTLSPEEEQETLETFEDSVERSRSLLTRLIAIQTLSNLSSEIQFDLEELDSKMQAHPDRDYSATLSTITTTLKELKLALGKSTINSDHQLRRVAKYLSSQLIDLSSEERKLPSSTTTTTIRPIIRRKEATKLYHYHYHPTYHPKKGSYQALPLPLPSDLSSEERKLPSSTTTTTIRPPRPVSYQRSLSQHLRETL